MSKQRKFGNVGKGIILLILLCVGLFIAIPPFVVNAESGSCDCQITVSTRDSSCSGQAARSYPLGETVTRKQVYEGMASDAGCSLPGSYVSTILGEVGISADERITLQADSCWRLNGNLSLDTEQHQVIVQCNSATPGRSAGGGLIEPCPNPSDVPGTGGCRDANILLLQLIKIAEYLFTIVGTIAFVFFIYGGFSLILSLGNAEKAKKAHATLFAAAVGLLIAFASVILVDFLLDVIGVSSEFRL